MLLFLAGVAHFKAFCFIKKCLRALSPVPSTVHLLICGIMPAVFVLIAGFIRQMTDTGPIKTVVRSYVGHSHY